MFTCSLRMVCASALTAGMFTLATGGAGACPPDSETAQQELQQRQQQRLIALTAVAEPRHVDLAICLDTSGSMNGLIEAAKIKLWNIVNDLALAKPEPKLRVALLTFGNNGHSASDGWVNIDSEFTDDLDLISQKLFALTTNGGTELVARVLHAAHTKLEWTAPPTGDQALKLIVVAGNESADQDKEMRFQDVCKSVISSGVMINSIYCGNPADNIAPGWREVAMLADGHFAAIDHNDNALAMATPFDEQLVQLSAALNETYVYFGAMGERAWANQREQDNNAQSLGQQVAAERCSTKAGYLYSNSRWDLVDACKQADFKLEEVKPEDLPEHLRTLSTEALKQHIASKQSQRETIQAQVKDISTQRQEFIAKESAKAAHQNQSSFDAVIRKAIRSQAASKGFKFVENKTVETQAEKSAG